MSAPQRQQLQLLFWAIFVAPIAVSIGLFMVQSLNGSPLAAEGRTIAFVVVGVALAAALGVNTVFRLVLTPVARRFPSGPVEQIAITPTVVAAASCEGAGMLCAVGFFLGGDVLALAGVMLCLVGMWPLRPSPARWEELERLVAEARRQ